MLISIITINYNDKVGFENTIKSVHNQTFEDFEHIVIDGNSNDGSKEVIDQYKNNFSYHISEPDSGIYNAMNKGVKAAKGDYILFLNSGDVFCNSDVLENASKTFNDNQIVYGNLVKEDVAGNSTIDFGPKEDNITLNTMFLHTINHPSTFIKRDLFQQYGLYDESLKIVSDWKFFLITLGLNNVSSKYINLSITRFKMDGISSTNRIARNKEREIVLKELIPFPIYQDYIKFNKDTSILKTNRFKMLLELEHFKMPKK